MTAVDTLISDLRGNRQSATDQPIIANTDTLISALQSLASGAAVTLAGDASGAANANQVTLTHLAAPLPIAQGGTNAATAAAALASLGAMPLLFAITNLVAAGTGTKLTLNRVDATTGALNIQMPAPTTAGDWVAFRKIDVSANRVTVQYLGTDMAWLSAQPDTVLFYSGTGATWLVYLVNIAPLSQTFLSSGTWTNPPLATAIFAKPLGAGGGGGSGRRGAAGSARSGGIGGFSGTTTANSIGAPAGTITATVAVTVGAAGSGGTAQTVNDTSGNNGTDGGASSFGTYYQSRGGYGGPGGTNAATPIISGTQFTSGLGTPAQSSVSAALSYNQSVGVGGTGGSISTGNAALAGAPGGPQSVGDPASTQAAPGATATDGPDGSAASVNFANFSNITVVGGGGGSGGASTDGVTVAGKGGAGANYGAGGAGGGASTNGSNSGAGGNGSPGAVTVVAVF